MRVWLLPPLEPMIEPQPAPEILFDNIGAIEWIDGYVRIYAYALETTIEAPDAPAMRVLKVKLFGAASNVPGVIGALSHCLRPWPDPSRTPPLKIVR